MFIRVKDKDTKHEYDVPEDSFLLRNELVVPIKSDRFPPVNNPRRQKFYVKLKPASRATASTEETQKEVES